MKKDDDRDNDRDDEWEGGAANGEVLRPRRSHPFPLPSLSQPARRSAQREGGILVPIFVGTIVVPIFVSILVGSP